ncbi:MAG: molybdopterin dinucleotide binding domain-containing protein, partial [Acidimicrobiales bacterium]
HAGVTAAALSANSDGVLVAGGSVDPIAVDPPQIPPTGDYTLRLVVSRKLYDAAVNTAQSPSMADLAPGARLHLNPYDFDRLGVSTGTAVKVKNGERAIALEAQIDAGVPRGSAWVAFNQPGVAVAELIDVTAPVTDIQVDTL